MPSYRRKRCPKPVIPAVNFRTGSRYAREGTNHAGASSFSALEVFLCGVGPLGGTVRFATMAMSVLDCDGIHVQDKAREGDVQERCKNYCTEVGEL